MMTRRPKAASGPKPQTAPLPPTLALRVQHLREARGMTSRRLSEVALVPLTLVEDIESGLETFLSPAIRQKLARALHVKSGQLHEVEKRPEVSVPAPTVDLETQMELLHAMLERPTRAYFCPSCGASLIVRVFERRDLNDFPVTTLKVNCSRCLFHLDHGG